MNVPKAIEGALAAALVGHMDLDELPRIRTFQAPDVDGRWTTLDDRSFPMVSLAASPPSVSPEDGMTLVCTTGILVATQADDDQDHADIAAIYSEVQKVLDNIYSQFIAQSAGVERTTFNTYLSNQAPDVNAIISIGGFTFGDGLSPYEEGGVNFIGITFSVHYSRSDY